MLITELPAGNRTVLPIGDAGDIDEKLSVTEGLSPNLRTPRGFKGDEFVEIGECSRFNFSCWMEAAPRDKDDDTRGVDGDF